MTAVAVMSREIRLSDGATPTTATATGARTSWVMLFPEGKYTTERHGTLDFTRARLAEIKAGFDGHVRGIDIAVDVDHRAPNANDTRAAGWLRRVEMGATIGKEPGLWGEVEWTPYGLAEVESKQYRYISSEYQPGTWKNEITGAKARNVLFGLTLTNRPVMKNMPAIQLADISTRAWGAVDKAKLPDSAFLDPKNRRLPVYEGAGPVVDGKYTQRGKLNINAVRAALAAVHGARSGKAMTGLPSGLVAKLQGWLDTYSESDGGNTQAAEVGRRGVMAAEDQELEGDEETQELAELDDTGDDDSESYADSEDAADGGDDEDTEDQPAPKAKKGAKKMSEGRLTLAEQQQLVERVRQLERKDYEHGVALILSGWEAGTQQFSEQRAAAKAKPNGEAAKVVTGGRPVKVVLSRVAMRAAKTLMLSEDFAELSETLRGEIAKVIELAATGAVDLSVRGGNNDTERVKTTKLSVVKPQDDAAAFETAWQENSVALAEAGGDDYAALVKLSGQNSRAGREAAEKVTQYQTRAYAQTLAGA